MKTKNIVEGFGDKFSAKDVGKSLVFWIMVFGLILISPAISAEPLADYGDAPDPTYPSLFASQGPYHINVTEEWIGTSPASTTTVETDALAPDGDFDDGVIQLEKVYVFGAPTNMGFVTVPITIDANADNQIRYLNVLADFNQNGSWQAYSLGGGITQQEWIVRNLAIINSPGTSVNLTVSFVLMDSSVNPPDQIWTRATLTTEFIDPTIFGLAGWNGTGPVWGFLRGETEDAYVTIGDIDLDIEPGMTMTIPPPGFCGDGILQPWLGEQCEPPNTPVCNANCQLIPAPPPGGFCGDGILQPWLGEQCDPPNGFSCDANCQNIPAPPPVPGDKLKRDDLPDMRQRSYECAPTSAADSLYWLGKHHGFSDKLPGNPQNPVPLIEKLKRHMNWKPNFGIDNMKDFEKGKDNITKELSLPIETHCESNPSKVIAFIINEMKNGQDVEFAMWFTDARRGGHAVAVAGYKVYVDEKGNETVELIINDPGDKKKGSVPYKVGLRGGHPSLLGYRRPNIIDTACAESPTTPPKTKKEYGTPYYTDGVNEWITSDTLIYLNVTYEGSGVAYTKYRVWYNGEWTDWFTYTEPFTMKDIGVEKDCLHKVEYYSVDNAGNEESWEEVEVVVEANSGAFEAYSAIAVDPFALNTIHMVYTEEGSEDLIYETSLDFGVTWTGRTVLVSGLDKSSEPDIKIAPNGDIHVVFHGNETGQHQRIYHIWYNFSKNDYSYNNAIDPANWENRVSVNDTGRDNVYPQIAIDSLNIVHCVWIGDSDGFVEGGAQDIFYSKFNETGWSPRLTLYANATTTPGWPNPQIIADLSDDLHVVFIDSNEHMMKYLTYYTELEEVPDDNGSGRNPSGEWGSYFGGSWNNVTADNVGNSSASYGTIAGMAIEGNLLHVAWQDVRDGVGQVYENTRSLTATDAFGPEWQITFGPSIDNDGTSVGEVLMESGEFDNIHLFYRDSIDYDIWYMEHASVWTTPAKVADSGPDHVHLWSEMAVDNFDSPLLSYTKATNDYTEYDIHYKKPYHNQIFRVDNKPPTTTKTVGGSTYYGPNGEEITTETEITLDAKDNCHCEKYAIVVVGRETGAILPEHAHYKNVIDMEKMLKQKSKETGGWKITKLVAGSTDPNVDATKKNLEDAFKEVKTAADEGRCCQFFFYYSDHGGWDNPDPTRTEPAGSINNLDEYVPLSDGKLYDDDFADLIKSVCKCKNTVIVIQACYSGGFIPDIVAKNKDKPMVICTSCREDERSYAIPCHWSVYNHFLTDELKKCTSVEKAHENAKKRIIDSGKYPKSANVHPQKYDSDLAENKFLYCCGVGSYQIHYRIWYDGEWGPEQVGELNKPVTFKFTEDCKHIREYWAVDNLGNEEEHHFQTYYVGGEWRAKWPTVLWYVQKGTKYSIEIFLNKTGYVTRVDFERLGCPVTEIPVELAEQSLAKLPPGFAVELPEMVTETMYKNSITQPVDVSEIPKMFTVDP